MFVMFEEGIEEIIKRILDKGLDFFFCALKKSSDVVTRELITAELIDPEANIVELKRIEQKFFGFYKNDMVNILKNSGFYFEKVPLESNRVYASKNFLIGAQKFTIKIELPFGKINKYFLVPIHKKIPNKKDINQLVQHLIKSSEIPKILKYKYTPDTNIEIPITPYFLSIFYMGKPKVIIDGRFFHAAQKLDPIITNTISSLQESIYNYQMQTRNFYFDISESEIFSQFDNTNQNSIYYHVKNSSAIILIFNTIHKNKYTQIVYAIHPSILTTFIKSKSPKQTLNLTPHTLITYTVHNFDFLKNKLLKIPHPISIFDPIPSFLVPLPPSSPLPPPSTSSSTPSTSSSTTSANKFRKFVPHKLGIKVVLGESYL